MIAPIYFEFSVFATKIEVGPSAAPMIPMEAASFKSKPSNTATMIVKKIPNCAAAPNNKRNGFCSKGPKSIIAPIPINKSKGNNSVEIPISNNTWNGPASPPALNTPEFGKFTNNVPNPMGTNKVGSYSFLIPKYINRPPMNIITIRPGSDPNPTTPSINVSTTSLPFQ